VGLAWSLAAVADWNLLLHFSSHQLYRLYRGEGEEADSFLHSAAYVAIFLQLIAGPII